MFSWGCIAVIVLLGMSDAERTQWVILAAILVKSLVDELGKWGDRRYAREHEQRAAMRQQAVKAEVQEVKQEVKKNTAVTILQNQPDSMTEEQKETLKAMQAKFLADFDPNAPNAIPPAQHDA